MTVRLGFFGAGFIARHHVSMLRLGRADAQIAAVFDPNREKGRAWAAEHGVPLVDSEEAVFDAADAVYVCTWTSEHPRLVAEAARRGLPVFCEKPLATSLADAVDMVECVRRAGVINQVGLVMRDYPGFLLLKRLLARDGVGRPMGFVFRDDQYIPIQGIYQSSWRADVAKCGAGTLLEHSIHDLDILEWLFGPVVRVSGRSAEFHAIAGIDDVVVATIEFDSGLLGTLASIWHDVLERPSLRRLEVFAERAYCALEGDVFGPVRWTGPDGDSGRVRDEELVARLHAWGIRPRNPDVAFVEAVRDGTPASPDFAQALRPHLLTEAIYRSCAERGKAVEVPAGVPGVDWI
ncbi:Gfo/Idh/MocA family oxidoreductase [Rhabdothermincola sp.]|uniref:Gfo/Idh/MocA family oxidoreductase n=1 Tax=Rhabdothermincola sp. TaxID=2820405 RepID=UPI002FDF9715